MSSTFEPKTKELNLPILPNRAFSLLVLGATRSGKSTLINVLLSKYFTNKIPILMTLSPNAPEYKRGFFASDKIIKIPAFMPELIRECYLINKGTDNAYQFLFIIDDVAGGGERDNKEMVKLNTLYRNSELSLLNTGQTMAIVNPKSRANTNFVLLGRMGNTNEVIKVIKEFLLGWFPADMKMIQKVQLYQKLTDNYHFIVIDNLSNDIYISKVRI